MNRAFSWSLAAAFALASHLCAQTKVTIPVASATAAPHIIPLGSSLTFGGSNSPDTYTATTTFSSTPVLVDNGAVKIWQDQVPTGADSEWDIFHMKIVNGGPLANNAGSTFIVLLTYTLSAAASFDAVANQFYANGTPVGPLTNIGTICCAAATNPILPGPSFYNSGFNGALSAGPQTNWQQIMIQPYSFISDAGVNPATANEFAFALHFTLEPAGPTVSGAISASAFGAFPTFAPGSWIEIYGTNLGVGPRSWQSSDFSGVNAPTTLVGSSVTIGGQSAFVDFVSQGQMNAQVPSGVTTGAQQLVVTTAAGSSTPLAVTVDATQPGLLAPASFKIGGTQYVAALFPDGVTFVLPPGAISGVTSRRAKPGDTIILYGVGFGSVNPDIPAGQLAQTQSKLTESFSVSFNGKQATIPYDGLAPNFVGLYQFNVVVPSVGASDTVPFTFSLGGTDGTQKLAIAVEN